MQGSGYSYRPPRGGGGQVRRRHEGPRPIACCCIGFLAILLLSFGALFIWNPDFLTDLQQQIARQLTGLRGNEPGSRAEQLGADYRDDPNQLLKSSTTTGTADDHPEFRQLKRFNQPELIDGRLSVMDIAGWEYALTSSYSGWNTAGGASFDSSGMSDSGYQLPDTASGYCFGWDFDRDGMDESVPVASVLEMNGESLDVPHYLWDGLAQENSSVVLSRGGEAIKVLHGLQPAWRPEFIPVGDLDGDGWNELVLTDEFVGSGSTKFLVYGNQGRKLASLLVERNCYFAGVADTNADGRQELILFDEDRRLVVAMSLKGEQRIVETGMQFGGISAVVDMSGDGVPELVNGIRGFWNPASRQYSTLEPRLEMDEQRMLRQRVLGMHGGEAGQKLIVLCGSQDELWALAAYNEHGGAEALLFFSKPMVDAAVIRQGAGDSLLLSSHTGVWAWQQ